MSKKRRSSLAGLDLESDVQDKSIEEKINKLASKNEEKEKKLQHIDRVLPISQISVEPEFEDYIRKQTADEFGQFVANLENDGRVREPLVVCNFSDSPEKFIIIDGHHRFKASKQLAEKHEAFRELAVIVKKFQDRDSAKIWMLENQLGRRNLTDAERIDIALKLTDFLAEKGIETKKLNLAFRKNESKETDKREKIDRSQTVADIANVSRANVTKFNKVKQKADNELKEKVLSGEVSIHKAYTQVSSKPKPKPTPAKGFIVSEKTKKIFRRGQDWKNGKITDEQFLKYIEKNN